MMRKVLSMTFATGALLLGAGVQAQNAQRYMEPPAALKAVADQARPPQVLIAPDRRTLALVDTPALPSIEAVAAPEARLAGLRINPRAFAASRFSFGTGLSFMAVDAPTPRRVADLPSPARIADTSFSPDGKHLAFTRNTGDAVELWVAEVASAKARRLSTAPLNAVMGRGFNWLGNEALLVTLRVPGMSEPQPPRAPAGPNVQDATATGRGQQAIRTFQDLLRTPHDEARFDYFATAQIARIGLDGQTTLIGKPLVMRGVSASPDSQWLLVNTITKPYSYLVPVSMFGRRAEVWNLRGEVVHTVANLPLREGLPPSFDAVPEGPRDIAWRADVPATLSWSQALDGGDPFKPAEQRDALYQQAWPFKDAPQELARVKTRIAGVTWGDGQTALLSEFWYRTRDVVLWEIAPDIPGKAPVQHFSFKSEDRYANPGTPVMTLNRFGRSVLQFAPGAQRAIYLDGEGASAEGDRPFVDRYDIAAKKAARIWRAQGEVYENPIAVLDDRAQRLLTRRETQTEPPNFFVRDLSKPERSQLTALTQFAHPLPQFKGVSKELIRYKRKDGVELSANLMLPAGYDAKRDGPLPFILWAYPQEFKTAQAAAQTRGSPHEFNRISANGPAAFLAMGYGVLDNPAMPIIGEGGKEPNDTYVQQLVASAEAAVEEIVRRGVADRNRIAVGGHSYGAFMTANLLAHTRLFKAGIARSGAYNRTLTPFGFQGEERTFWKAPETYAAMSAFNNADKIKDALLLIHGENDSNSGTFPIQSERLYQALRGLGGTTRLVMLPHEDHGYRARESIMHMLWETNNWLERYVKNAK
jgi:dipeptidyl aminopeptidase/acylaminoacyl peptidase